MQCALAYVPPTEPFKSPRKHASIRVRCSTKARYPETMLSILQSGMVPIFFFSKACVRGRPAAEVTKPSPHR